MKFRNPLLAEGFNVFFSTKKAVNSYLYYVAFLALILLASWPNKPAAEYIASTNIPFTFNYVTIFLYIHLTILAARYSTTRIAGNKFHPTSDWLDHTSVSRGSIILGRTAFGIFHVLFLFLLALPFIAISGTATGITIEDQLAASAVILSAVLTYRIVGIFLSLFLDERPFLFYFTLWSLILLLSAGSLFLYPEINPVQALLAIVGFDGGILSPGASHTDANIIIKGVIKAHLILSIAFTFSGFGVLLMLPRKTASTRGSG